MKKNTIYKYICLTLSAGILCSGCGSADSLTKNIKKQPVETVALDDYNSTITDFAVRLFQESVKNDQNTLLSPLSVLNALAMTANGASGNTLVEMEETFGLSMDDLNKYLYTYNQQLPNKKGGSLHQANGIWFSDQDDLSIKTDFLQKNVNYYDAELYETAFGNATADHINSWVKKHTDGMIPKIVDTVPEDAVMYLVNALSFEGTWSKTYKDTQVREDIFTKIDGTNQTVPMMSSTEWQYLEEEEATGFIKYYKDNAYAFAALLPNEDVTISDYISHLTGEQLYKTLSNPIDICTWTKLPKFEYEYGLDMNEVLQKMGIWDAFQEATADFSNMTEPTESGSNIYINKVLHQTFISVAEQGTKAGAATVVEMNDSAAPIMEYREVYLNRPFVYVIMDCENRIPIFIGMVGAV